MIHSKYLPFVHLIPVAFLFFDDFMSLSGGVSFGLLGDATKFHPWRIWSWRIGCYQGLISRMFVAVSMKEKDVLRKRSMWFEQMKIKENAWKWMKVLWRSWLRWQNSRWVVLEHVLMMRLETQLFSITFLCSASQKMSSVKTHRKRRKPRLTVAASVGLVAWVDGDFATASCFWGDAHENEVVQKNCMKFWDGRTVWQCHHAIIEALLVGPLEGGRLYFKSVTRYILTDGQQGWNNHLQITSLNPGARDDLLFDKSDRDISMLKKSSINYHENLSEHFTEREREKWLLFTA